MTNARKAYHLIFTTIKNGEISLNRMKIHTNDVNTLAKDFFGKNEPYTFYKFVELDNQ